MHLRRALPWYSHIGAIKHRFFSRHIIVHYLKNHAEFAHHDLCSMSVLLLSEEGKILAHSHTLDISQLAHKLAQLDD